MRERIVGWRLRPPLGAVQESPWVERLARFGLLSKAVLYAVIGGLAVAVAAGTGGQETDKGGALRAIARQPAGEVMLFALAAGLGGYAVWRIAQGVFDRDDKGTGPAALATRASKLGSGVIYAGLMALAVWLVIAEDDSGAGGGEERQATGGVLGWPAGRWIVMAVGAAVIGVGLWNFRRGLRRDFLGSLRLNRMSPGGRRAAATIGLIGLCARGVVFALIGGFFIKAAIEFDPKEAVGFDGALARLAGEAYGAYLLGAVALGLIAYALLCLVEAGYKDF